MATVCHELKKKNKPGKLPGGEKKKKALGETTQGAPNASHESSCELTVPRGKALGKKSGCKEKKGPGVQRRVFK